MTNNNHRHTKEEDEQVDNIKYAVVGAVAVHSQVRRIKQELEKIMHPAGLDHPEIRSVLRDFSRQQKRSRSPLGIANRRISVVLEQMMASLAGLMHLSSSVRSQVLILLVGFSYYVGFFRGLVRSTGVVRTVQLLSIGYWVAGLTYLGTSPSLTNDRLMFEDDESLRVDLLPINFPASYENGKLEHFLHRWMKNREHKNFWLTMFPEKRYFQETTNTTEVAIWSAPWFLECQPQRGMPSTRALLATNHSLAGRSGSAFQVRYPNRILCSTGKMRKLMCCEKSHLSQD
ncbi:hypothetical protein QVD17_31817 [Tagetes erecta]|uniref:Uncharacterized protein n=1 Tax=Tagetes erecta TaxID=13708 RepID=A0AAD8NNX4_TARER|nr:hypothetical protein QVD17_31817 [Tagetes erecta]